MTSAYEEALARIESGESGGYDESPGYIKHADTMSMANGNPSFYESAAQVVEDIPKFVGAAVVSGAAQIYNIVPDVGNLLTGTEQFERADTSEILKAYDNDMSLFYEEHKDAVDLVGFMAGSLVPGLAGVKALHAGQATLEAAFAAGKAGSGMSRAMGLAFNPRQGQKLKDAIHAVSNNITDASITSRTATKAVLSGIHQNALEGMAYEIAVASTMFNSPLLENQDLGDITKNILISGGAFGLLGGVISGVATKFKLVGAEKAAFKAESPYSFKPQVAQISDEYEKLMVNYETLATLKEVPTDLPAERIAHLTSVRNRTVDTLNRDIRNSLNVLAKDDQLVSGEMEKLLKQANQAEQVGSTAGLIEIAKPAVSSPALKRIETLKKKIAKGKNVTDADYAEYGASQLSTAYAKHWGQKVGTAFSEEPAVLSLADKVASKKRGIEVKGYEVSWGNKDKFKVKFNMDHLIGRIKQERVAGTFNKFEDVKPVAWDPMKASLENTQARYVLAMYMKPLVATAEAPLTISVRDMPFMEKVFVELSNYDNIKFEGLKEGEYVPTPDTMLAFLEKKKTELIHEFHTRKGAGKLEFGPVNSDTAIMTADEIAVRVNVTEDLLAAKGRAAVNAPAHIDDLLAHQSYTREYKTRMEKAGIPLNPEFRSVLMIPQHTKMVFKTRAIKLDKDNRVPVLETEMNNFIVENMAIIKEQQRAYQGGLDRATAGVISAEDYARLPDIETGRQFTTDKNGKMVELPKKDRIELQADPEGAGSGIATAASHNYGSLASTMEQIGHATANMITKAQEKVKEIYEPLLHKLVSNQEAYLEWSVLQQRIRAIEGHYALNEAGDALEPIALQRWRAQVEILSAEGRAAEIKPFVFEEGLEESIPLVTEEVRALATAHVEVNGLRTSKMAGLRTAQGLQFNRPPEAFYPIPVNPKEYSYFALVTDKSITGGNTQKTLFATSEKELKEMVTKLESDPQLNIKIQSKQEAEDHFRSIGEYSYEKTLNRNYLDTAAHRKGVSSPYLVSTDPKKIVDDFMKWHNAREAGLIREAVAAKYEVPFTELMRMGKDYTNFATSKFSDATLLEYIDELVKNPFGDYVKTALNITKNDYPWMINLNKMADEAISRMYKKVATGVSTAKTPQDWNKINDTLRQSGYKGAAYDETMGIFANAQLAKGTLSSVVQKANSVLATVVLRWDTLNAVNNAISANVLLGAETSAIIRGINKGDANAVGALAELRKLAYIKVPGTDQFIMSPSKMIANSMKRYNSKSTDFKFYKDNGFIKSISDQYRDTLEDIAYDPRMSVSTWDSKIEARLAKLRSAGDKGELITGNRLAEDFNRFVAADVMKQLTDVAVANGVMTSKEALAYINTFVNRTQGNYLAAQRPQMFQGALGQSMGLFQTYQFNLMQQLLRHVGEGGAKDAMTLLGLQATIHGMNGLPGFNAVNQHLIGTASGNTSHTDAYDIAYGALGKEAGDWITYGLGSNVLGLIHPDLKINLYTRGDLNPRHVTLVPTNPANFPTIQASMKFFGNIVETGKKINAGADVSTALLQGLEKNGISRPLAGLAQTLQGINNPNQSSYSTTNKGNLLAANDVLSWANLTRLLGGKPLDEAIALDASYRFKSYGLEDAKRRQLLGKAIKTTMMAGQDPTQEQIEEFAQKYAELGGKADQFNQWFSGLYQTATLSQANSLQRHLNSPFSNSMKLLMGGEELEGF